MGRLEYRMITTFDRENTKRLYSGISWYRKGIVDNLEITGNRIEIIFNRSSSVSAEDLFSPLNPVRYEFYRAVCFYTATTGNLPPVKSIILKTNEKEERLEKDRLTRHWDNCSFKYTIDPAAASKCFQEDGKAAYIAITYFLKAQLDPFPHDKFRAAWSGLNSLYSTLTKKNNVDEYEQESAKIKALKKTIETNEFPIIQSYVESLDENFWKNLEWYNFIRIQRCKSIDELISQIGNTVKDKTVFRCLSNEIIKLNKAETRKSIRGENSLGVMKEEALNDTIRKRLNNRKKDSKDQMRFLVTDYAYMLRNRSFHAAKAYPVFCLFDDNYVSPEEQITDILLLMISELLPLIPSRT